MKRKHNKYLLGILASLLLSFEVQGNTLLLPQSERYAGDTAAWPTHYSINPTQRQGKYGAVDSKGKILIPFEFDYVSGERYPNGCYYVEENTTNGRALGGLYKPGSGLIFPCIYESIYYTDNPNLYKVRKNGKLGVLDADGKIVVPISFTRVVIDENAIRTAITPSLCLWNLYDLKGNLILDYRTTMCDGLSAYNEGYCLFTDSKGEGIIDLKGNKKYLQDNYKISRSWSFGSEDSKVSEGLFAVYDTETERWGYMSTNMELIIPCKYSTKYMTDYPPNFKNGRVNTTKEGLPVVLDHTGKEILAHYEK